MFPLLKSTNLTDWRLAGHMFPQERPAWAGYYFRAPEISQFTVAWNADADTAWQPLPASGAAINEGYLPPWNRGVRVGVAAWGSAATSVGAFENFKLASQP